MKSTFREIKHRLMNAEVDEDNLYRTLKETLEALEEEEELQKTVDDRWSTVISEFNEFSSAVRSGTEISMFAIKLQMYSLSYQKQMIGRLDELIKELRCDPR